MSSMMRALVKARAEPGIWMEQVPVPEIGPNDVLIKVRKTAASGHGREPPPAIACQSSR